MSWTTSKSFEKPFDKFPNDKSVKFWKNFWKNSQEEGRAKLMKDHVLFYKESVVYPYVNFERKGKKLISNIDYVDVISYAEKCGMSAI